jgi:AraC-like DNA-binding protein
LALHQRPGTGPATVFFDGQAREDRSLDDMGFRRLLDEMDHRFATAAFDGLEVLKESYLTETFNRSFHTPNEIRLHFSYALDRLAETSGKVLGMEAEERVRLRESLGGALDEAVNLHEIMMAFREALSRLERLQSSPSTVSRKLTLEKTKEYIDRHLGEPLRIADLARRSGLSVTTFGREFARLTGVGLETYLQALRLREARRLLRGTNQPWRGWRGNAASGRSRISRGCSRRRKVARPTRSGASLAALEASESPRASSEKGGEIHHRSTSQSASALWRELLCV